MTWATKMPNTIDTRLAVIGGATTIHLLRDIDPATTVSCGAHSMARGGMVHPLPVDHLATADRFCSKCFPDGPGDLAVECVVTATRERAKAERIAKRAARREMQERGR